MNTLKYIFFAVIAAGILAAIFSVRGEPFSTLKVAATSTPHALILEQAKPLLEKKGIVLEIFVVDDYQIPNRALVDGDVDANFFQNEPFLEIQKKEFGYGIIPFGNVHLEPMGLYSLKVKTVNDIPENGVVTIPNDPSNQSRALNLLEKAGLITLKKRDVTATKYDILENPKKLQIVEVDAAMLPRTLDDTYLAVIPANFALQADLSPVTDALLLEDRQSSFANFLAIRQEDSEREDLLLLREALTSPEVKEYIEQTFNGAVIPAFADRGH